MKSRGVCRLEDAAGELTSNKDKDLREETCHLPPRGDRTPRWLRVLVNASRVCGTDRDALFKRLAYFVDRVIDGAKPADIPIEQPVKFQLAINLSKAKALGLNVSSNLMLSADELIE
jgi:hypothetical protein